MKIEKNTRLKKTHIIESYSKDELLILKEYLKFCIDNFSESSFKDAFIGFCYGVKKYLESKKINIKDEYRIELFLNEFIDKYIYANRTTEYSFYFCSIYERKELAKKTIIIINKIIKIK